VTAKIVLENLKHKPMRSLLSILLVGVPVTLILCLVGLSHGMLEDTQRRTRAIGADIIVRPPGSNLLSTGGAMPAAIAGALEKRPHVKMAVGVLNALVQGVDLYAAGIDLASFNRISGGFKLQSGASFQQPDDVMIDEYYASEKKARVGSYLNFLNRQWRVCGIYRGGMLSHIVFPLRVLQDVTEHANQVSQVYVKLDDPANTDAVIHSLKSDPGWGVYKLYSMDDFMALQHQQHSRTQGIRLGDRLHRRRHRFRRDVPLHVYGCVAAHTRNRHPEVAGRVQRLRLADRPGGSLHHGRGRHRPRRRHELRRVVAD
jgi:putative ABC transport system permease protein